MSFSRENKCASPSSALQTKAAAHADEGGIYAIQNHIGEIL